jgi:hypothetical protein
MSLIRQHFQGIASVLKWAMNTQIPDVTDPVKKQNERKQRNCKPQPFSDMASAPGIYIAKDHSLYGWAGLGHLLMALL